MKTVHIHPSFCFKLEHKHTNDVRQFYQCYEFPQRIWRLSQFESPPRIPSGETRLRMTMILNVEIFFAASFFTATKKRDRSENMSNSPFVKLMRIEIIFLLSQHKVDSSEKHKQERRWESFYDFLLWYSWLDQRAKLSSF